jgi:hypothetical protein
VRRKTLIRAGSRGAIIAAVLLFSTAAVCFARLILVPLEYEMIQDAINTSASGDTIRVADGTYPPGNDLGTKDLVILSENYLGATVGADPGAEGFYLGGQTSATLISGFRIQDCSMGVHVNWGNPRIENCSMEGCSQSGVFCNQSGATFQNCNSHDNSGAGFRLSGSHVLLNGCYAIQNHQSGIEIIEGTNNIDVCLVEGNIASSGGGGINCYNASPLIQMVTIGGNRATGGGGGGIYCSGTSHAVINTCTISRNAADQGGGIYVDATASAAINNTILWGNCAPTSDDGVELWADGSAAVTFDCSCVNPAWTVGAGSSTTAIRSRTIRTSASFPLATARQPTPGATCSPPTPPPSEQRADRWGHGGRDARSLRSSARRGERSGNSSDERGPTEMARVTSR